MEIIKINEAYLTKNFLLRIERIEKNSNGNTFSLIFIMNNWIDDSPEKYEMIFKTDNDRSLALEKLVETIRLLVI